MTDQRPIPASLTCDEVRDLAAGFVLDALDADEAAAVRAHLAECDDAHAELLELAAALPVLDAAVPQVAPPPGLRARIQAAAAEDLVARETTDGTGAFAAPAAPDPVAVPVAPPPSLRPVEVTPRRGTSTSTWLLRIAAVLAIALLGGWNLLLQGQLSAAQTYEQHVAAVLEVAGQPGSLTAVLTAEGGTGPAGLAAVSASGEVVLAMRDLPQTHGSQVYETWVIAADGVPVALGGFAVGRDGTGYFEGTGLPTDPGIVLALTLEPAPGATAPSSPAVSSGAAMAPA